eukprot:scaffold10020_cov161-Skeletonema_marinoi.AAC.22
MRCMLCWLAEGTAMNTARSRDLVLVLSRTYDLLGLAKLVLPRTDPCRELTHQDQKDVGNNSLNSCPATLSASGAMDDEDLLDSPMTHPPRTVIIRTGTFWTTTPRKKNSIYRKRLFSIDFSTICTEREEEDEGLLGEEEDLSVEEETSVDHNDDDDDDDYEKEEDDGNNDDDDTDDEWDDTATFSTYPPTSIMLVPNNHLDAIATPHRSRMYRGYSDLSSTCSSHGHNSSLPPLPLLTPPKLEEPKFWAQDEYESLDDETDEDEDQIPHLMSCPDILGDSEDEDDFLTSPKQNPIRYMCTPSRVPLVPGVCLQKVR